MTERQNLVFMLRSALTLGPVERNDVGYSIKEKLKQLFIDRAPQWNVQCVNTRFTRRITAIEWHPIQHHIVTIGSHGGEILLWDHTANKPDADTFINGEGFGYGCITQLVYNREEPHHVYCSSVNGTVSRKDFLGKNSEIFTDTLDIKYWWTSLAYSDSRGMLFAGGNTGKAILMDRDGNKICEYSKFHKGKINHAEFNPCLDNMFVTASNDRMVALWDVRCMTSLDKPHPLYIMKHDAPINSAHFDPLNGSKLLTTVQNSELRLYESYRWEEPSLIMPHPHRHFQHMTNIKATWHPLFDDVCIVGRYPCSEDKDQTRCVDIIDLKCARVVGRFMDCSMSQLMVVNKFNKMGDILATGMGFTGLLWKPHVDTIIANARTDLVGVGGGVNGRGLRSGNSCNGPRPSRNENRKRKRKDTDTEGSSRSKRNKSICVQVVIPKRGRK